MRRFLIPFSAAVVGVILFFSSPSFFQALELKLLDEHFHVRGPRPPRLPLCVVAIDEASLEQLGRWPWPRTTLAQLLTTVAEAGARVIGLDVILAEPDQNSASDNILAAAVQRAPVVLPAFFSFQEAQQGQTGIEPATPLPKFGFVRLRGLEHPSLLFPRPRQVTEPLPAFAAAARNLGHVNILPDADGTVRRETLVLSYRGRFYPSLALQIAKLALAVASEDMLLDLQGSVQLGSVPIPLDVEGRMLFNFAGPGQTFPHYSAADVLRGAIPAETFKDAIVLIGATAIGIFDLRVTPYSTVFPGVEIHATAIENILAQTFLRRPPWMELVVFGLILLLPAALGILLGQLRPLGGGLVVAALLGGLFGLAQVLLVFEGLWFPVFYPMLVVAATYIPVTVHRALTEERQRLFIKRAFQQYVPEGVVSRILADPSVLRFGGERRELTIMFTDVRSFTTYSEQYQAELVVEILHEYLTQMVEIIFRNEGTLDKFIGDGVMAIFGAPVPQPDHAVRACKTALEMTEALQRLQHKWRQEGKEPLRIGIAVNTGEVIVGNLGSDQRFDYTVLGDPVNLAARLESLNKEFPQASGMLISEFTYEMARERIEARPLGEVMVRGKTRPVIVYELIGMKTP